MSRKIHPAQRKRGLTRVERLYGLSASQLEQLDSWLDKCTYAETARLAAVEWPEFILDADKFRGDLFQFRHRNDESNRITSVLARSAAISGEMMAAARAAGDDPLAACEYYLSSLANKTLAERPALEEMEMALQLFKTARTSQAERVKADLKREQMSADAAKDLAAKKSDAEKALELCLEQAKLFPEVQAKFKDAFAALKKAQKK
ncbi:MAG TPA: hypothetical protein VIK53_11650 [Verrucomicrobiae bacterium]